MSSLPNRVVRRLLPLYAAAFLQGLVLFYTIEKLFMQSIGFDYAGIGMMVAAYSALMILIETPSGILADRWSRKGVLILAGIFLAGSALVGGLSHGIAMYLVAAGLWGVFYALYSGTYDSIIYDTLLEEGQDTEQYERYYGWVKVANSAALVLGCLIGGVMAAELGLRATYFWSVPLALGSIVALLIFKEPKLHKKNEVVPISRHVRDTFAAILKRGQLTFILAAMVMLTTLSDGVYEFGQLWWIALALPVVFFGPANALLLGTIGLGGWVAGRIGLHRQQVMYGGFAVMLASSLGLVLSRVEVITIACQVVLATGLMATGIVFNRLLHDELDSRLRAGAASAVSTLTRVVLIVFALLFGLIAREVSVFAASWMYVVVLVVCLAVVARMFASQRLRVAAVDQGDPLPVEPYQK